MNKKAIAILGAIFLLIVGTLGFLVYSKYAGNKTQTPPAVTQQPSPGNNASSTNPTGNNSTTTPAAANSSGIVKLTGDQVVSPALFFNGTGITYFDNQGNLFQATVQDQNGQIQLTGKKQLTLPAKANISKILWPPRGNDFIAQITNPSTGARSWSYYNSSTGAYADLPSQVESLDWMPNGTQIMYIWLDNGKASLSLGNPDTTHYTNLADMWETDDAISVSPDGSQILYYETNNASTTNAINSVTADGKVWKGLVTAGQNFGVLWSPNGQKFLFEKKDPTTLNYQLWVYNLTSGEIKNLGLFTTVDKAVWGSDNNIIYAAVPQTGTPGTNSLTIDTFYRMDTTTLEKKQYLSDPSNPVDGRNLFLNAASDKLIFKNAQDGALYYLDLNQGGSGS